MNRVPGFLAAHAADLIGILLSLCGLLLFFYCSAWVLVGLAFTWGDHGWSFVPVGVCAAAGLLGFSLSVASLRRPAQRRPMFVASALVTGGAGLYYLWLFNLL